MHEDGLADMADGFVGMMSKAPCRSAGDSRIGSYGVLALILATAMWLSLLMVCLEMFDHRTDLFRHHFGGEPIHPVMQLAVFPLSPHARLATPTGRPDTGRIIMALAL